MADVTIFEPEVAQLCDDLLAISAQIERIVDHRWSASQGANYEAIYNSLAQQTDKPVGGNITKNQMNNAIAALNTINTAILSVAGGVSTVAEFSPRLLNNGA